MVTVFFRLQEAMQVSESALQIIQVRCQNHIFFSTDHSSRFMHIEKQIMTQNIVLVCSGPLRNKGKEIGLLLQRQ